MAGPETLTDEKGAAFPTLVVPGLGAPNFHTDWIAARLEREGIAAVNLKFPWMAVGDMNRSAEQVAREVRSTLDRAGADRVNLVGYSLGGLIARMYLQEGGGHAEVHRSVFVAAPQDSIYTACLAAFTPAARQILPHSGFIRDLNQHRPCPCGEAKCLSIFLARDGTILPSESARLPCGYNLKMSWPVMHWGIVFSPKVVRMAADFLKGRLPEGAVAGDQRI